jgi:hypothetical protein
MEKAGQAMKQIHNGLTPEKVDETMYVLFFFLPGAPWHMFMPWRKWKLAMPSVAILDMSSN